MHICSSVVVCISRHEIKGCEVIWTIKDSYITSTFVDAGAAQFFLPHLNSEKNTENIPSKRLKYVLDSKFNLSLYKLHVE